MKPAFSFPGMFTRWLAEMGNNEVQIQDLGRVFVYLFREFMGNNGEN